MTKNKWKIRVFGNKEDTYYLGWSYYKECELSELVPYIMRQRDLHEWKGLKCVITNCKTGISIKGW